MNIPNEAVVAAHSEICEESLEDHLDPDWPGRCIKAVEALSPILMTHAWEQGWDARAWGEDRESPYRASRVGE